jgi:hypothetical protein
LGCSAAEVTDAAEKFFRRPHGWRFVDTIAIHQLGRPEIRRILTLDRGWPFLSSFRPDRRKNQ